MQALGEGIFRSFFFSLPGLITVYFIFPMQLSSHPITWISFIISIFFSFIINTQINLLTGILTFFLFNNDGLIRAKRVCVDLFSGVLLPISFYQGWAQKIMSFFLFQAISYIPSMIFTEGIAGEKAVNALLFQGLWSLVLIIPIQVIWVYACILHFNGMTFFVCVFCCWRSIGVCWDLYYDCKHQLLLGFKDFHHSDDV